MNPPKFVTNKTSKLKYRDTLRRWLKLITQFAKIDSKAKAVKEGLGHLVYLSCDGIAQDVLNKAEKTGNIKLDGEEDDGTREKLVESIIEVIAKDSPTDSVKREVDLMTGIQKCERKNSETVRDFVSRFNGAVARYVNQTVALSESSSRQFAVLMLRNARVTSDTMNSLIFQLTSQASSDIERAHNISISKEDALCLVKTINENIGSETIPAAVGRVANEIEKAGKERIVMFTIEEATSSLSQVTCELQDAQTPVVRTMLGKRSFEGKSSQRDAIKRLKEEKACHHCGEKGHWWRDRMDCRTGMIEKWETEKGKKEHERRNGGTRMETNEPVRKKVDFRE